jgi:hypothetical protein
MALVLFRTCLMTLAQKGNIGQEMGKPWRPYGFRGGDSEMSEI